jgi:hypothetical protein
MAAAKKRGEGGGSNMGLIVTLVFFVLATVILGVMTYMGFADQAEKEKQKAEAEKAKTAMEAERNWYRFQARMYREYMGRPPAGKDATEIVREKGAFDKNQLSYAGTGKEEVAALFKDFEKTMPWDGGKDSPKETYESIIRERDRRYAALEKAANQLRKEKEDAERVAKDARDDLEKATLNYKDAVAKLDKKADDDRTTDRATIATLRKDLGDKGAEKEKVSVELEGTKKNLVKAESRGRTLQKELEKEKTEHKANRDLLDDTKLRLSALAEKSGVNLNAQEAEALDARAVQMLKSWTKPWRVVEMDRRGTMPYINLGSNDGLTSQVTFSVHAVGPDGKLVERPKGTVEVVRVIGPHLSQARVTSTRDGKADPILKGDKLFNPTWDPYRKRHVAIAGIADLGGDGTDNTEDFRKLLERQNVILDGYIDTKDKDPKIVGKGVTLNTDYLILGDSLESIKHPKSQEKEFVQKYDKMREDMRSKAVSNGVTVVTLRRYLDMIGYTAPKVISSGLR